MFTILPIPSLLLVLSLFAGLLKELLKSDHFASVVMSNSRRGADSENTELLEGENPLPLVLKKVIAEGVYHILQHDLYKWPIKLSLTLRCVINRNNYLLQ